MTNFKKSMKQTVIVWIILAVMFGFTIFSAKLANADSGIKEQQVAAVVMWFTADGKPQNIWIVDYTHLRWVGGQQTIIDRTPNDEPPDAVINGGLVQVQYFGFREVFEFKYNTWRLREKFNTFALQFKAKAGQHLGFEKQGM